MDSFYLLNTDISFYVKKLDNHIQRRIHSLYNRRELQECSLMNMWVADYLFHMQLKGQEVFQKDVEAEFYINRATASKMLSLMEEKELIRRVASPEDGRLKKLELLPKGIRLQKLCERIRTEIESQVTAGLSAEEIALFKSLMQSMIKNMD